MLLRDFREPSLSFKLMHFRSSFCYRVENNWSFKYKKFSRVGPLGTNLIFFISPGIAEISGSSIHSEVKSFYNTLNYTSTANIQKIIKFYNADHKSLETDFS